MKKIIIFIISIIFLCSFVSATLDDYIQWFTFNDNEVGAGNLIISIDNGTYKVINGSNTGADTGVAGNIGEAYSCVAGNGDYINTTWPNGSMTTDDEMTISFWMKSSHNPVNTDYIFGSGTEGQFYLNVDGGNGDRISILSGNSGNQNTRYWNNGSIWGKMADGNWHMVTITNEGRNCEHNRLFIDGGEITETADACTTNALGAYDIGFNFTLGNGITSNGAPVPNAFIDMDIDDYVAYNRTLTDAEITELFNNGLYYELATFKYPSVSDGDVNNTIPTPLLNISCDSNTVTLWFNQTTPLNFKALDAVASPALYTPSSLTDNTFSYIASCNGDALNTTIRTWTLDSTSPNVTITENNFYNTLNSSKVANTNLANIALNFTDLADLYAFEINITNSSMESVYYLVNSSLTGTEYFYRNSINISNLSGIYTSYITVADSHTAQKIKDYNVIKKNKELEFNTVEGNTIKITTQENAITASTKKGDRYNFGFNFIDRQTKDRVFNLYCDNELSIRNTRYKAHFVCSNGIKGNWIDFEGLTGSPIISKITDKYYQITFKQAPPDIVFNSIGGLNQFSVTNTFEAGAYAFNITFLDDITKTKVNIVNLEVIGSYYGENYSTTTGNIYINLDQADNYTLRYSNTNHSENFYYLELNFGEVLNLTLYLANITGTDEITATVYDNYNNLAEGVYIYVQKYDITTNNYLLVGEALTNFEGVTKLDLIKNTEYYKFLLYYPWGTLRQETSPTYIYDDNLNFQISLEDEIGETYYKSMGVDYSLTFLNDSNYFKLVFNDVAGDTDEICLYIYKIQANQTNELNMSCLSVSSGTILLPVTPINSTTYEAQAYASINPERYFLTGLSKSFYGAFPLGSFGVLAVFIITAIFAFIAIWNIALAIIVTPIPLIIASGTGFIQFPVSMAIVLWLGALVLAVVVSRQ